MADKLLGAIGLCRKAGKLVTGADPVAEAAQKGTAILLLTAQDFAPRSKKQAASVCERFQIQGIELSYTMEQLSAIIGKHTGVLAICDTSFARMISGILGETER